MERLLQGAHDPGHFADGLHGLGQVLHSDVLHNIYPPEMSVEIEMKELISQLA